MTDTVDMPSGNPSRKLLGATVGATGGIVVANLVEWGLDDYVFDPHKADSVPGPVEAFVMYVVPIALTFIVGYMTKRGVNEVAPTPPAPPAPVAPPVD